MKITRKPGEPRRVRYGDLVPGDVYQSNPNGPMLQVRAGLGMDWSITSNTPATPVHPDTLVIPLDAELELDGRGQPEREEPPAGPCCGLNVGELRKRLVWAWDRLPDISDLRAGSVEDKIDSAVRVLIDGLRVAVKGCEPLADQTKHPSLDVEALRAELDAVTRERDVLRDGFVAITKDRYSTEGSFARDTLAQADALRETLRRFEILVGDDGWDLESWMGSDQRTRFRLTSEDGANGPAKASLADAIDAAWAMRAAGLDAIRREAERAKGGRDGR